jgi:hypothetical protein
MTRLPRGVERLLGWTVPLDQQEPIAGDLLEAHALRLREHGFAASPRAWAATWWSTVQLAAAFAWERLRRDRTLPPIADEPPRRSSFWETLAHDVVFGVRALRRQPGFASAAVAVTSSSERPSAPAARDYRVTVRGEDEEPTLARNQPAALDRG